MFLLHRAWTVQSWHRIDFECLPLCFTWKRAHYRQSFFIIHVYSHNVQYQLWPTSCIQTRLNTATFYRNIGHPSMAMLCHNGLPLFCFDFLWENHDITQPYMLPFSFNAASISAQFAKFCCSCIGEFLSTAFYSRLLFCERSVAILITSNQGRTQLDTTHGVRRSQFVLCQTFQGSIKFSGYELD